MTRLGNLIRVLILIVICVIQKGEAVETIEDVNEIETRLNLMARVGHIRNPDLSIISSAHWEGFVPLGRDGRKLGEVMSGISYYSENSTSYYEDPAQKAKRITERKLVGEEWNRLRSPTQEILQYCFHLFWKLFGYSSGHCNNPHGCVSPEQAAGTVGRWAARKRIKIQQVAAVNKSLEDVQVALTRAQMGQTTFLLHTAPIAEQMQAAVGCSLGELIGKNEDS